MRISIRGEYAKCRSCQGHDFIPAYPLPAPRRDVLICAQCGNEMIYSDLAGQARSVPPSTTPLSQ
jgi:hypothetical protein